MTQIEEDNARLQRVVDELSLLNDIARDIGATFDMEEVIRILVHRSVRAVRAEQGMVTLADERTAGTMRTLVRAMATSTAPQPFHMDTLLLGWMQIHRAPVVISEPRTDPRFMHIPWDASVRDLVCVPLLTQSRFIGLLSAYNKLGGGGFTEDDRRLLSIIASQSAQVVENARLLEEEKTLTHVREQLRLALQIQQDLLPKEMPDLADYAFGALYVPAQIVGGDYYDFISIDDRTLAVCVGDASGKGLPASLLMSNLQAILRGQVLVDPDPVHCLERANLLLHRSTSADRFVTLFYGVLDARAHSVRYGTAGHEGYLLPGDGSDVVTLKTGGIPLGMLPEFPYASAVAALAPGDTIVVASDGIAEAWNAADEQFGEERLIGILRDHRGRPPSELMNHVHDHVLAFCGDRQQSDDITLCAIQRRT